MPRLPLLICVLMAAPLFAKDVPLNNDPVQVVLPVNQEIRIDFPEMVTDLNVPAAANDRLQTLLKPNGVLHWKATGTISDNRVIATTAAGDVILLDIRTGTLPDNDRVIRLVTPAMMQATITPQVMPPNDSLPPFINAQLGAGDGNTAGTTADEYDYSELAAFAFQHYLGPARLVSGIPATRVKVPLIGKHLLRVWGDHLQLRVLNSWLYQGQYITAVQVRNTGVDPIAFDPRAIRGHFLFIATLHEVLQPRGSADDTTVWVFISDRPFSQAVGGK